MVGEPKQVQDLLRIPDVLRMIRLLCEQATDKANLPQFANRSQLYLEVSRRMLERAMEQQQEKLARFQRFLEFEPAEQLELLRHAVSVLAFQMCLEQRYDYSVPSPKDGPQALRAFLEQGYRRFARSAADYYSEPQRKERWNLAVDVLKTIELRHRSVVDVWTAEVLSFRSRKMMEWYAGYYLANYATAEDLQDQPSSAADFASDDQWHWVWRFAIELPRSARDPARLCGSLSLLFRYVPGKSPPTELMFRCWHLFEIESQAKIRDKFPYERDDQGRIQLLPGAAEVIRAWRWSFWHRFHEADREIQLEGLWLVPEDLLWTAINAANGTAQQPEIQQAAASLGLSLAQLRQLGEWLEPHRDEILTRWQTAKQRSWPGDPWLGETYYPLRAYQNCPPAPNENAQWPTRPSPDHCQRMVEFWQGASEGDNSAGETEKPRHLVRLPPIQVQTFSVTLTQYNLFHSIEEVSDEPVGVRWYSSWVFGKQLGPAFRLPTESEYECAIRGGTETAYWWESHKFDRERCIYRYLKDRGDMGRGESLAAQDRYANRYGLLHAAGNREQWIWDGFVERWYHQRPDGAEDDGGPTGVGHRVFRGNFLIRSATSCRSSSRYRIDADNLIAYAGFRLCRVLSASESSSDTLSSDL